MSIPTFGVMPAPTDPSPADGVKAHNDSIAMATSNFAKLGPWSSGVIPRTSSRVTYSGAAAFTPAANWTRVSFEAIVVNHFITIDATLTYNGTALTLGSDGWLTLANRSTVGTLALPLRPKFWPIPVIHARMANTGVFLDFGVSNVQPQDSLLLQGGAVPARVIPSGSQLVFHLAYFDQTTDVTLSP